MSHSENNLDRQVKRHKGPLYGMIAAVVFVAVLLVWWLGTEVDEAPGTPEDSAPATQGNAAPVTGTAPGDTTPAEPVVVE